MEARLQDLQSRRYLASYCQKLNASSRPAAVRQYWHHHDRQSYPTCVRHSTNSHDEYRQTIWSRLFKIACPCRSERFAEFASGLVSSVGEEKRALIECRCARNSTARQPPVCIGTTRRDRRVAFPARRARPQRHRDLYRRAVLRYGAMKELRTSWRLKQAHSCFADGRCRRAHAVFRSVCPHIHRRRAKQSRLCRHRFAYRRMMVVTQGFTRWRERRELDREFPFSNATRFSNLGDGTITIPAICVRAAAAGRQQQLQIRYNDRRDDRRPAQRRR